MDAEASCDDLDIPGRLDTLNLVCLGCSYQNHDKSSSPACTESEMCWG